MAQLQLVMLRILQKKLASAVSFGVSAHLSALEGWGMPYGSALDYCCRKGRGKRKRSGEKQERGKERAKQGIWISKESV